MGQKFSCNHKSFLRKSLVKWAFVSMGQVGGVMESVKQFREFARLEINGKWYRISDYMLLRMHVKLRKKSESAAGQDLNADGDMSDAVWVNDGSLSDQTNQGW